MRRRVLTIFAVISAGFLLGVLAKIGDVIPTGNILSNFISGFGRASSGFTLWIFVCLLISNKSENRTYAVLHVTLFLISMLAAYYAYSQLVVGYLSLRVVRFWLFMLIPSAAASYIVYGIRKKPILKVFAAIAAACLGVVGILFIEGLETYALIIECILLLSIGIFLFKKDRT